MPFVPKEQIIDFYTERTGDPSVAEGIFLQAQRINDFDTGYTFRIALEQSERQMGILADCAEEDET